MSKKKNKKKNSPEASLSSDFPAADSAEFVPTINNDILDTAAYDMEETYDFIPEIKTDKFS